jgi:hypothetical protein
MFNRPKTQLTRSGSSTCRILYQCTGFEVRAPSSSAQLGVIESPEPRRQVNAWAEYDYWT